MRPRPRLIAELVTLTRPWGWTLPDLARELHVSLASLNQYRSGRRPLSMDTYGRIAERFGDYRHIRDAAWEYARAYHAPITRVAEPSADLPVTITHALARFVERFPEEAVRGGRGLFLCTREPRLLAAAVAHIRALFAATQVQVVVVPANRVLSSSELREALAAPLAIIERVDFLHPSVADLLRHREEIVRPTIATSLTQECGGDADIRRIVRDRMRLLVLDGPSRTSAPVSKPRSLHAHAAA